MEQTMSDTRLDALLTDWATAPVAPGDAGTAADAALAAIPAPRRWWPVAAGGALAASVALALVALPAGQPVSAPAVVATETPAAQSASAATADEIDSYAYRMMFTETPEEEMTI